MATAATKFVPEVIAAGIEKNLEPNWVWVDGCNKSYEGSIKRQGDSVKIRTVGKITAHLIARTDKRGALEAAEEIDGEMLILKIDQIAYTNTFVDSIDELATDVSLMDATTKEMASAIANKHDTYVAALVEGTHAGEGDNSGKTMFDMDHLFTGGIASTQEASGQTAWALTKDNIDTMLLKAKAELKKRNIPDSMPLELIVTPDIEALLVKKAIIEKSNNVNDYVNGKVGTTLGVTIKVSNNVYNNSSKKYDACCLRVRDKAMAFAQQISKVIHYRMDDEKLDMDFIKSYSLFGAKVLFPDYAICIPVATVTL